MHKDFHLYATYLTAKLGGFNDEESIKIACAAQGVDDFTYGEYAACNTNPFTNDNEMQILWSNFHFLPSKIYNTEIDTPLRFDTAPNGFMYEKLVDDLTKSYQNDTENTDDYKLAMAGVAMHVFADTYAHNGFSGLYSPYNIVENISINSLVKSVNLLPFGSTFHMPVRFAPYIKAGKLGHVTAGHMPDISWIRYTYNIKGSAAVQERDNKTLFVEAFMAMTEVLHGIKNPGVQFDAARIRETLNLEFDTHITTMISKIDMSADSETWRNKYYPLFSEDKDDLFYQMVDKNTFGFREFTDGKTILRFYNEYTKQFKALSEPGLLRKIFSKILPIDAPTKAELWGTRTDDPFFNALIWHRSNVMTELFLIYPQFPKII